VHDCKHCVYNHDRQSTYKLLVGPDYKNLLKLCEHIVFSVMVSINECQVPTNAALSLPLLNWTGEKKYDERLTGQDKGRERSLTNYRHGQNKLNSGRKKIRQSNQSRIMRNKTKS